MLHDSALIDEVLDVDGHESSAGGISPIDKVFGIALPEERTNGLSEIEKVLCVAALLIAELDACCQIREIQAFWSVKLPEVYVCVWLPESNPGFGGLEGPLEIGPVAADTSERNEAIGILDWMKIGKEMFHGNHFSC